MSIQDTRPESISGEESLRREARQGWIRVPRYERKNHGAIYVVSVRGGGVLRGNLRIRDRAGVHIATDGSHADSGRWVWRRELIATPCPWSEVRRQACVRGLIRLERQWDRVRVVTAIRLANGT